MSPALKRKVILLRVMTTSPDRYERYRFPFQIIA
jgi:hypothetical protein